ncbi:hypothetical protein RGQ29_007010 [Quercus rubra]|uniref:Uncharacterized protein n=1 Tax=Quercus rubra TaxID=3512 RepID=A0AAN7E8G1_QUERU|nr:hypothetical protein RGQ29_007010 [Quercus rubra]
MGRSACCAKEGLNRGAWTAQEDKILTEYIRIHGEGKWRNLPKRAGLKRCGKSCRLRWLNYLRPDIKRGNISPDEEELIIRLHKLLGNRWSLIARRLPGRTDNEIKNYWNTNLGKRVGDPQCPAPTPKHSYENKLKQASKQSNLSTHVIRTKAIRCSKVFLTPQPRSQYEYDFSSMELEAVGTGHQILDIGQLSTNNKLVESDTYEDNNNNHLNSLDFMMNFNMEEVCLTDLLSSDFPDMFDITNYSDNDARRNDLSSTSEQPLILSEQLLQDWTTSSCVQLQPNVPTNLQSLASLLDSGEEWLAQ